MIYNVMLVSGVQQRESVIHIYISTLCFFRFFSHIGRYRVLSRVPCARQQVLISYFIYYSVCICWFVKLERELIEGRVFLTIFVAPIITTVLA